jgi:hypothetical protein
LSRRWKAWKIETKTTDNLNKQDEREQQPKDTKLNKICNRQEIKVSNEQKIYILTVNVTIQTLDASIQTLDVTIQRLDVNRLQVLVPELLVKSQTSLIETQCV